MRYFLVEFPVYELDRVELERTMRMLRAAQIRLSGSLMAAQPLFAGLTEDDGRLACLIEAPCLQSLRRMVALALLPAGRIRELAQSESCVDSSDSTQSVSDAGTDLCPRVDPELVEDVVDMSFDGPFGYE